MIKPPLNVGVPETGIIKEVDLSVTTGIVKFKPFTVTAIGLVDVYLGVRVKLNVEYLPFTNSIAPGDGTIKQESRITQHGVTSSSLHLNEFVIRKIKNKIKRFFIIKILK